MWRVAQLAQGPSPRPKPKAQEGARRKKAEGARRKKKAEGARRKRKRKAPSPKAEKMRRARAVGAGSWEHQEPKWNAAAGSHWF